MEHTIPASSDESARKLAGLNELDTYTSKIIATYGQVAYKIFVELWRKWRINPLEDYRLRVLFGIAVLFDSHPELIMGFSKFLPRGWEIQCVADLSNGKNSTTLVTPTQTFVGQVWYGRFIWEPASSGWPSRLVGGSQGW